MNSASYYCGRLQYQDILPVSKRKHNTCILRNTFSYQNTILILLYQNPLNKSILLNIFWWKTCGAAYYFHRSFWVFIVMVDGAISE